MDFKLVELCPICIENDALYFTECGHKYCLRCLSRINKCAICRKLLLRSTLCVEIKKNCKEKTKEIPNNEYLLRLRPNFNSTSASYSDSQINNLLRLLPASYSDSQIDDLLRLLPESYSDSQIDNLLTLASGFADLSNMG